jgi:uncharacterized protein YbaA (DUF1428 family)
MSYADGFVIPVPKKQLKAYTKMAQFGKRVWMKHGALDYQEFVADDIKPFCGVPFPKAIRVKPGETVVFSYIVYKSRAHRDRVNAKVMKDPAMTAPPGGMPFDFRRMIYGGFRRLVGV